MFSSLNKSDDYLSTVTGFRHAQSDHDMMI